MPEIRHDLKPGKSNWDHQSYKKFKVKGQEEASFDNDVKRNKPTGNSGGHSNQKNLDKPHWNDKEYTKYDVEEEEGADFGETEEEEEEDYEDYEDYEEYEDYSDEEDEDSDG